MTSTSRRVVPVASVAPVHLVLLFFFLDSVEPGVPEEVAQSCHLGGSLLDRVGWRAPLQGSLLDRVGPSHARRRSLEPPEVELAQ